MLQTLSYNFIIFIQLHQKNETVPGVTQKMWEFTVIPKSMIPRLRERYQYREPGSISRHWGLDKMADEWCKFTEYFFVVVLIIRNYHYFRWCPGTDKHYPLVTHFTDAYMRHQDTDCIITSLFYLTINDSVSGWCRLKWPTRSLRIARFLSNPCCRNHSRISQIRITHTINAFVFRLSRFLGWSITAWIHIRWQISPEFDQCIAAFISTKNASYKRELCRFTVIV